MPSFVLFVHVILCKKKEIVLLTWRRPLMAQKVAKRAIMPANKNTQTIS